MWEDVSKFIQKHKSFVLTTHINPEGDAVGSELALAAFLRDLGKRVTVVNSSPTPANCLFLRNVDTIRLYPEDYTADILDGADAAMIVDVNNWEHVGPFGVELRKSDKPRACIDHHQAVEEGFASVTVCDTKAAAAGLLIYDLIVHMRGEITPPIGEAIYTAIFTDTGSFRFSNTDERVFRAAADLCAKGVSPFEIYRKVHAKRWGAARLIGSALSTLGKSADGKIAWIHVTQSMFNEAGAEYEDSDALLELIRPVEGVELCLFFKETENGGIKVSLRSNGKVNAFAIAKRHGGGGHRMAAGMTLNGPMRTVIEKLVAECANEPGIAA
ncbi:MAG: phosphoesterase [Candidatus Krumholzibacteriota bacterium]|nr:phosphoesterase [Candidatus Krumholzibacteriota bacterium]